MPSHALDEQQRSCSAGGSWAKMVPRNLQSSSVQFDINPNQTLGVWTARVVERKQTDGLARWRRREAQTDGEFGIGNHKNGVPFRTEERKRKMDDRGEEVMINDFSVSYRYSTQSKCKRKSEKLNLMKFRGQQQILDQQQRPKSRDQ